MPAETRNERKRDKVLRFKGVGERTRCTVTQRDLAEERLLTHEAAAALQSLERKRRSIRRLLESGATIEPGLRSAKLMEIAPEPYSVTPKPYKKLVVR